jgi:hypothetical protein
MARSVALVVLLILTGQSLFAQGTAPQAQGSVRGTVEDVTGGVVSNAAVALLARTSTAQWATSALRSLDSRSRRTHRGGCSCQRA